ncbi:hypothetical protein SteCoe_13878 [Stentor coeruleus]|uniref:Uncharacterized protein n=1 Tax=Stentor coeruleus TaxID=5963 RepID=A0A1R2C7B2_9CILI|nr:hypothetical protein SteCoe_13878 [Stentor coeruleus]
MEDRLLKFFECARMEGTTENDMIKRLYGDSQSKVLKKPEYKIARKNGLNIIQAELATLISQELKLRGVEGFLARFECSKDMHSSFLHKKRQRKSGKDESELKKKSKL